MVRSCLCWLSGIKSEEEILQVEHLLWIVSPIRQTSASLMWEGTQQLRSRPLTWQVLYCPRHRTRPHRARAESTKQRGRVRDEKELALYLLHRGRLADGHPAHPNAQDFREKVASSNLHVGLFDKIAAVVPARTNPPCRSRSQAFLRRSRSLSSFERWASKETRRLKTTAPWTGAPPRCLRRCVRPRWRRPRSRRPRWL